MSARTTDIDSLLKKAAKLPPMTELEMKLQRLCFAYGNLAASTNHFPQRDAFKVVATRPSSEGGCVGLTEEEFEEWAKDREWR